MRKTLKGMLGVVFYLGLVLAPLILLLATPTPPGRGFWRELAVALGFAGLSLMGLQFIPTARLGWFEDVFPTDTLYAFHHWTSVVGTLFVIAHPVILIADNPNVLILFDLANAPWRARAGIVSGAAVVLLTALSVWRKDLDLDYEPWRVGHNVLAIGATGLALWHIFGVRYYLALPSQRVLWIALPVVWTLMLGYTKFYKPIQMLRHPYQVKSVQEERGDCWTVSVEPVGHEGISFEPGQFAWLTVDRSPFAIREHPFSITSSAVGRAPLCFTIKELGDFTSRIGEIEPGTRAYVDGPHGEFSIEEHEAPGYVFLAGGIGSAPMVSMLRTMADREDERSILMFYGSRSWDDVTFQEEFENLETRLNVSVIHVLENPPSGWEGETGYISEDVLDRHLPKNRQELVCFISGPVVMIDVVRRNLLELGIPRGHIYEERYEMA